MFNRISMIPAIDKILKRHKAAKGKFFESSHTVVYADEDNFICRERDGTNMFFAIYYCDINGQINPLGRFPRMIDARNFLNPIASDKFNYSRRWGEPIL